MIQKLKEKVIEVNIDGVFLKDAVNEYIELVCESKSATVDDIIKQKNIISGYLWTLSDARIISDELKEDILDLCLDMYWKPL